MTAAQTKRPRLTKKRRALFILERLKDLYPEAPCSLDYENPLQLLIATMLSAQCTDARVNIVTPALFERFPTVTNYAEADVSEIETYVKSTGFYRNKAKNIRAACEKIILDFSGEVPQSMETLTSLPGVARKTANVVLAHAFGINAGVTVDTHVKRITQRLGLTKHDTPVKIEQDLMKLLPQPDWENWSIRLVYHGRAVCDARKPACERCQLIEWCSSGPKLIKASSSTSPVKTS
ncbi:endonuclease III [Leptolyngbya cf. ectocarpi LEGE 11479]|uniref:Endonuclease III n=1 Tax=Leptolyngbya cf. ectocarpi LEGE 11479 TaxID=1828722 RepID=A0A928ZZ10_LEPEC|nr:endonuclease III [Leptolyngbya ectocarpi]MBE9070036.1 endonuclease III [Leptolyngbya cf. ectocarpi LEGE 11479]